MRVLKFMLFSLLLLAGFTIRAYAQNADSLQVGNQQVIELGVQEIKISIEAPQVKLFTERIKPDFDDIHLDKSFIKEIVGQGEKFVVQKKSVASEPERIDVEKLLKKIR